MAEELFLSQVVSVENRYDALPLATWGVSNWRAGKPGGSGMKTQRPKWTHITMVVAVIAVNALAQTAYCQRASIAVDPESKTIDVKGMTSSDLKEAITYAMEHGDLDQKDGKELIDKITDVEVLMQQFDFIRDQERRLMSSVGSPFH